MGNAGVGEGGEAVIGGAIGRPSRRGALPARECREPGQDLIHEDLHAAFGVPDGR